MWEPEANADWQVVSLLGNAVDGKQNRLHLSGLVYFGCSHSLGHSAVACAFHNQFVLGHQFTEE